jgi:cell division protein FtsA
MNFEDPIGIIELGDLNIKCIILKIDNSNSEILSTAVSVSKGIHNDLVVNLPKASDAIRSCISIAEKKANLTLKKIHVILEQPDFLCTKFSKQKKIGGSRIEKDDIDFLLKESKKQLLHNDKKQSVIHIFNYNYIVDGKNFDEEPIGVYADLFTHEVTFITLPINNLKNIEQVFIDCDIEIERVFSRTFTLGVKLLPAKELHNGSILIDFDFDKVSMGLFKKSALIHSVTLPVGANHISKDISKVCSLDTEESENIKNGIDFLFKNNDQVFDENNFLKKDYFINSSFRKISKNLIINVVKARLDEIIDSLKKQINIPDFNLTSNINTLLTGAGSNLLNVEQYFINYLGLNLGKKNSRNNEIIKNEKDFAACLGAAQIIKDGWETEAIPEMGDRNTKKSSFLGKIFGFNY